MSRVNLSERGSPSVVAEEIYRFRLEGEQIDLVIELTDLFGLLVQLVM